MLTKHEKHILKVAIYHGYFKWIAMPVGKVVKYREENGNNITMKECTSLMNSGYLIKDEFNSTIYVSIFIPNIGLIMRDKVLE